MAAAFRVDFPAASPVDFRAAFQAVSQALVVSRAGFRVVFPAGFLAMAAGLSKPT
jgi:hypothetical protein